MKLEIDRLRLSKLIKRVKPLCASKGLIPIQETIRLSARDDRVYAAATNGTAFMECHCTCQVFKPGEVCVPGYLLQRAVEEMSGDDIKLSTHEQHLYLETDAGEVKLPTLEAAIFPELPFDKSLPSVKVMAGVVMDLYRMVSPNVADNEDSRLGSLNGIYWKVHDGILEMQATDNKGFIAVRGPAPFQNDGLEEKTVVSEDAMRLVIAMTDADRGEEIEVRVSKGAIQFLGGSGVVIHGLLAARFPDCRAGVKKTHKTTAAFYCKAGEFARALRQASVVGDRVHLVADADEVLLEGQDEHGTSRATLKIGATELKDGTVVEGVKGRDDVHLDNKVMKRLLHALPFDSLVSTRLGGNGPTVIQALSGDFMAAISPMTAQRVAPEPEKKKRGDKKDRGHG